MQEDTHYLFYNNIVQSGYNTHVSFSYDQNEDEQEFTYPYYQNDQHSEYYTGETFFESEDYSVETGSPQSSKLDLPSQKSNKDIPDRHSTCAAA